MSVEKLCHCGKPLHYRNPFVEALTYALVEAKGEYVNVTSSAGRTFRVQRHYIALHGIKEQELHTYGFEEVQ